MEYEELSAKLNSEIKPAYMINGQDGFLTMSALAQIEKALNLSMPDMNKTVFADDFKSNAKEIVASCDALPLIDSRRLVVVYDYVGKKDDKEKEIFVNYLKNPNMNTCLVFYSSVKSDFFSSFASSVENISCDKVSDKFLYDFAKNKLKENNLNIDTATINLLIDYCNHSVLKVNTEIDKLSSILSAREDRTITREDVDSFITKDIEFVIFDLTGAISNKNADRAYEIIESMLRDKEPAVSIISLISNHFRRLFFAGRTEGTNKEIADLLSVKEYAVTKYKQQAQLFSNKTLKSIFDDCVDLEYKVKSGEMEGKSALFYLVAKILA